MQESTNKYWRFQMRAVLTRLGIWGPFERWRLRRRFRRGIPHETDFAFFGHFTGRNELFVDVGANLGQSALSFRLAHRTASILSFEPNPDLAPALGCVKSLLGASFDFRLHGLGARTELKQLYVPCVRGIPFPQCATFERACLEHNDSAKQLFRDWTGSDRFDIVERPIQLVRFDELELSPAFVKIDVEGGEEDVIAGMEATIARCRPIFLTEGCAARTTLGARGYSAWAHEQAGNYLRPPIDRELGANVFFVPAEKLAALERIGALIFRDKSQAA